MCSTACTDLLMYILKLSFDPSKRFTLIGARGGGGGGGGGTPL